MRTTRTLAGLLTFGVAAFALTASSSDTEGMTTAPTGEVGGVDLAAVPVTGDRPVHRLVEAS